MEKFRSFPRSADEEAKFEAQHSSLNLFLTSLCYLAMGKKESSLETLDNGKRLDAEREMCLNEEQCMREQRTGKKNGAEKAGKAEVRGLGETLRQIHL